MLLIICALAVLLAATAGLRNMRALARKGRALNEAPAYDPADNNPLPPVSVIVYAKNVEANIRDFMHALMAQDYPDYEVIVVNDASIDNTAEIIDTMLADYSNLKYTFVPSSSRNVSRRKVAFTLGAKAASHPVLLITDANSVIPSANWLRRMASPFARPGISVVLGTSFYPVERQHGAGRWYRQFDTLSTTAQWLGSALARAPYRGDAFSLAFLRDTFFEQNGFAASNRFVAGEDDLFINAIAHAGNTAVVLHPEACMERIYPEAEYARMWLREKERYTFTSRYLNTHAFRMQGLLSICQWTTLLSAIGAALLALPNLLPACMALLLLIILWGYEICLYRRTASLMHSTRLFWAVPIFWLIRPIVNALLRIKFRDNKSANYTWQHAKCPCH